MKRDASIAAATSSPIASVCCFQLPRHLFLPVGVEKDRESSIAQTMMVYEYTASLCYGRQEAKCMERVEGWMKKKSVEDLEDHRCHLPTVRSPTAECITQEEAKSFCYISIFRCAGVRLKSRVAVTVFLMNHQRIES
jgi:hypothetical protein